MRLLLNKFMSFGAISVAQKLIALVLQIQIIAFAGETEFGAYIYLLNITNLVAMVVVFGFPQLLTREIAYYHASGQDHQLRGILRFSSAFVAVGTLIVAIVGALACWSYCSPVAEIYDYAAWIAILLFTTLTLTSLQQAILRGLQRVMVAAWPMMLLQPLTMLGLVVASKLLDWEGTALELLIYMVVGNLVASIFMAFFIRRALAVQGSQKKIVPSYSLSVWWRSLLPFFLLGGIALLMQRSDILILGIYYPPEDIGVYAVAAQLGFLAQMPIMIVNSTIEPQIAAAHARNEYGQMRKLYADLSVLTGVSVIAVCAGLWLAGPLLLTHLFGPTYINSYHPLLIIALGFAIGALIGPTGTFLSMVGKERMTLYAVGGAVVLNIALNFLLIPLAGLEGAAIATSVAMVLSKVIMAVMVWRELGIRPGPLGYFGLARANVAPQKSENVK